MIGSTINISATEVKGGGQRYVRDIIITLYTFNNDASSVGIQERIDSINADCFKVQIQIADFIKGLVIYDIHITRTN